MSSEQSAREVVEDGRSRDDCGETDDVERIFSKLAQLPSYVQYPILMERCRPIVQLWHDTFSESEPKIWKKMKRGIPKELNEIAFILDEMINMCNACSKEGITIIDMCSGFGFLSMFLSHLLPSQKVGRIIPIDILFLAHNANKTEIDDTTAHHLPTKHLTSDIHPIPIRPRKANIKKGRELKQVSKYCISSSPSDVVILGVHLCKSLSVHTTKLFTMNSRSSRLYLKPCCLVGRRDLQRRNPPFWSFENMNEQGGFGVKTLYCEEIYPEDKLSQQEVQQKLETLEPLNESKEDNDNSDNHKVTNHVLFTKWCKLLRDAAKSAENVDATIKTIKVQENHFQNQLIYASRNINMD